MVRLWSSRGVAILLTRSGDGAQLLDALICIGNSMSTDRCPLLEEGDDLANLLSAIWQADASLRRLDAAAVEAFRRVLLGLAAQKREVAMELASRMGVTPPG